MTDQKLVLVIEDDSFYADIYKMKLQKEGIRAEVATDGAAGLALAKKETPALILTDLVMPGKDGFEMLRALKEDETLSQVPVIVLSNLSQAVDIQQAKELGAREYLIKSNTPIQEVIAKVKKALAEA